MNAFSSTNYAQEYNLEPFSHLIQHMRLDVEVYHNAQVCGNWVINKDEATHTSFHMVTKGDCPNSNTLAFMAFCKPCLVSSSSKQKKVKNG